MVYIWNCNFLPFLTFQTAKNNLIKATEQSLFYKSSPHPFYCCEATLDGEIFIYSAYFYLSFM